MLPLARWRIVAARVCAACTFVWLGAASAVPAAEAPYHLVENWPQLPPNEKLGSVAGVAVDAKGIVYAFLRDTDRILKFDESGKFLGVWTHDQPSLAKGAHALMIDSQGFFWLTDRDGHQVKKFSPDGKLVQTIGTGRFGATSDTMAGPTRTIELKNGNMLVSDGYWNSRLLWFTRDGKFIKAVGSFGRNPGQFGQMHDVVEAANGRLYVVDLCRGDYPYPGVVADQLDPKRKGIHDSGPYDLAGWTSNEGWRCDATNAKKDPKQKRIQVLDKDGKHIAFMPMTPLGIGAQGNMLFIADEVRAEKNFTIRIFDATTGKEIESFKDVGIGHAITVAPSGDLYLTGLGGGAPLRKFSRK